MSSFATTKLIEALKLTTTRLNDFFESNGEIFGDLNPSPYGFMIFCSFLVIAGYAPAKRYFPNSVVEREEADTEEFKQIVIQSMTQSLMERHSGALALIETEEEKDRQVQRTKQQVTSLLDERYSRYFECFQRDVEKLAEDRTNVYANLSAAFMADVLGKEEKANTGQSGLVLPNLSFGLCLSTTVSGLMTFFDGSETVET